MYFIAQKMSLFDILEALLAYVHNQIRFLQAKEVILNGNANDKNRGNQMTGPGFSQIVLRGVNYYLPLPLCKTALAGLFPASDSLDRCW